MIWLQTELPARVTRERVDVLFCPDYLVPWRSSCPTVAVVYDLLSLQYPQWGERIVNWQLKLCLPLTVRCATRLVTPSEASRRALLEAFPGHPERVTVIPCGVGERFRQVPLDEREAILAQYQLSGQPFLLSVGMWSPRKNLVRLLEAFARLRSWYPGVLVFVGGGGWSARAIQQALDVWDLRDRVRLIGFVPDDHLPAFYSAADLFVFPSLYEGFGLPVLEAMACGCPVVASNTSSIPEVAGDAAVLVDPLDEVALATAMREVIQSESTRARLRQAGLRRARAFTWAQTAQRLEEVFQAVGA